MFSITDSRSKRSVLPCGWKRRRQREEIHLVQEFVVRRNCEETKEAYVVLMIPDGSIYA